MTGNEFIKRTKRWAKTQDLEVRLIAAHGKGSHSTLYVGEHRTTIKDRGTEIGPGLLRAMLRQLNINPRDF